MNDYTSALLSFQTEQENYRSGEGHRDGEKVESADERSGHGLNFAQHGGTEKAAQISDRVNQADAACGSGFDEKESRQGPESRHVGFESDERQHETGDRQQQMPLRHWRQSQRDCPERNGHGYVETPFFRAV